MINITAIFRQSINWGLVAINILFALLLFGCEKEGVNIDKDPRDEVCVKLPIQISVGTGWTIGLGDDGEAVTRGDGTRSVDYDSDELVGVTEAQIYAFRRPAASSDDEPYRYDPTNSMVLPFTSKESEGSSHVLKGEGYLYMQSGFEYKVIAISYSTDRKSSYQGISYPEALGYGLRDANSDLRRFYMIIEPEMTLEDFKAHINHYEIKPEENGWNDYLTGLTNVLNEELAHVTPLTRYATEMPHLFYCECKRVVDESEATEETVSYRGVLRGGMAKVEVNVGKISGHTTTAGYGSSQWIALLADNVKEEYAVTELGESELEHNYYLSEKYTCVSYVKKQTATDKLTAYLWPGQTHLALRVRLDGNRGTTYYQYMGNYQLCPADNVSNDPVTGEVIVNTKDDVFYLRPNHKYVINVEEPETHLFNHELK